MFYCEMKVREESTRQPGKKHKEGSAADPARRQLPRGGGNWSADRPGSCGRERSIQAEWRRQAESQALERTNCGWRISVVMQ